MVDLGVIGSEATVVQRVVKRYSNRKLYDTKDSRYVTLLQIAEMIRSGEEVQIIDNASKEDKTDVTLALIISEELRAQPRAIPLSTLKSLIRDRGDRLLIHLRSRPLGRYLTGDLAPNTVGAAEESPSPSVLPPAPAAHRPTHTEQPDQDAHSEIEDLLAAVRQLNERLEAVEGRLAERDRPKG